MFEDLDTAESKDDGPSDVAQEPHWWIGPWAHVIAGVTFCLIYFPLDQYTWSWQVAVTLTYIVFMLCCTCGLAFKDSDDLFGNLRVPEFIGKLLFRQIFVLALVSAAAYVWRYSKSVLPEWVSHEGRRMSLWDYFGIILFYVIAVSEAKRMANKIKSQLAEPDDPV